MTRPEELDSNSFYELEDLIRDGLASLQEAATAIQEVGIHAFDSCGRYLVLQPDDNTPHLGVSVEAALEKVSDRMREECNKIVNQDTSDPREDREHWRLKAELPLAQVYGWRVGDLPDFKTIYENWCARVSGSKLLEPPNTRVHPNAEASARRVLRGLVIITYGEDAAKTLDDGQSPLISEIQTDLETKGINFDAKTLRRWLKNTAE